MKQQSQTKRKWKKLEQLYQEKNDKCDKVFKVLHIYIKYLTNTDLNEDEEKLFLNYSKNSIYKNTQKIELTEDQYLNENDYSMGDIVLEFRNPDMVEQQKYINYQAAMIVFKEVVSSRCSIEIAQDQLDEAILELAYQYVYSTLEEGPQMDEHCKIDTNKLQKIIAQFFFKNMNMKDFKEDQEKQHSRQSSKSKKNDMNKNQRRKTELLSQIFRSSRKNEFLDLTDISASFIYSTKSNIIANALEVAARTPINVMSPHSESSQNEPDQRSMVKSTRYQRSNNRILHAQKCKIMYQGRFLKKKVFSKDDERWVKTSEPTKDFMTLMRHLVLLRLAQKGFKIRQFLSKDGKSIFVILYAAEANIANIAEILKMRKFLNIEFTDIFSFEPVDQNFRPLRLNNRLWRADEYQNSPYFTYIRPKIKELLEKINFKKIAKELNVQNLNETMFSNGKEDIVGDEIGPSDEQWEAFYEYLMCLERHIQEARRKFYFKIEFSVLMNPKRVHGKYEIRDSNKEVLQFQINERYGKNKQKYDTKKKKEEKVINYLIQPDTNKLNLYQMLYEQLIKIIKRLRINEPLITLTIDQIISKGMRINQDKKQIDLQKSSKQTTISASDFYKKVGRLIRSYKEYSSNELELKIIQARNSEIIKKLAIYLDDNDNKWIVVNSPYDDDSEYGVDEFSEQNEFKDELFEQIVEKFPKYVFEFQEQSEKLVSKTQTKDLDTDFADFLQMELIKGIYVTLIQKEITQWEEQIKEEKVQFLNLKDTLHLKSDTLCTKYLKEKNRGLLAQAYGKAFREALEISRYKKKDILKNLWDYEQFQLIKPAYEFQLPNSTMSFKKKCKILSIFRKYQVSESGRISSFSIMERLKLINQLIYSTINIPYLLNGEYLKQIFCINDNYELFGISNRRSFLSFADSFRQRLSIIDKTPLVTNVKEGYVQLQQNRELVINNLFVDPKLFNLREIWSMRIKEPWFIPKMEVRDYYGEKIALYFIFLGQYTKQLLVRGLLGLICQLIQSFVTDNIAVYFTIIYSLYHTTFLCLMVGEWQITEKTTAVQFGQTIQEGQVTLEQRPAFQGSYRRDPVTDEMNTLYFPFINLIIRMIVNAALLILIFSMYLAAIIGLFYMTKYLDDANVFDSLRALSFLKLEVTIPCIINVVLLNIFDYFYEILAQKLTELENHETVNDFEANFIMKKFTLLLLSYFAPIFMITFLNNELGIDCAYNDCLANGSYYFTAIFIILFLFNAKEILMPIINSFLAKKEKQVGGVEKFTLINTFIFNESLKENYMKSVDRYGTVEDYMEIIIQVGLLALFGPLFPASMFVGFIWNVMELQTDKEKLLQYSQRPVPLDEKSIGIWNVLLEFLSNFAVIYNSGVIYQIAKTQAEISNRFSDITIFLFVLFTTFILRYIIETLIPSIPYELQQMINRQKYLLRSTIEQFKKKGSKEKQTEQIHALQRFVIYKPYGCVLSNQQKQMAVYVDNISEMEEEEDLKNQKTTLQDQQLLLQPDNKSKQIKVKIYYFEFITKKSELGKIQRKYNERVKIMKKKLHSFEKIYNKKWLEYRFLYRNFYIKRSFKLLKNLNLFKLKFYLNSYQKLFDRYLTSEKNKLQKQMQEDQEAQLFKATQYSKKKAKQLCRKVVTIKTKGVWFSQYRRQVPVLRSKELIYQLRKKHFESLRQHHKRKTLSINNIKINDQLLINERWKLFEQIYSLEIQKTSSSEIIKLLIRGKEVYNTLQLPTKNNLVRTVESLYSLSTKKIEQLQTEIYHHEFPSTLRLMQEQFKSRFFSVNQRQNLRQINFAIRKPISGFQTLKYPNLSELFCNSQKPIRQLWLIQQSFQQKLFDVVEIRAENKQEIIDINNQNTLLNEFDLFDQFIFPYSKGIIGRVISPKNQLLYGWTLRDTVKIRTKIKLFYTEQELLLFLSHMIKGVTLEFRSQIITPSTIVAYINEKKVGYEFIWQSFSNSSVQVANLEFLFCSQEQMNHQSEQLPSMIYNMGMIMVYLMTLGEGFDIVAQNIESQKIIDINQIQVFVSDYLIEMTPQFMEQYPVVFTIVQDMLLSENQRKSYQYIKKICDHEFQTNQNFYEPQSLSKQLEIEAYSQKELKLPFEDFKLYDVNQMINQHYAKLLHQALSQELFKLDILYKFKLITSCNQIISHTQKLLIEIFQLQEKDSIDYLSHITEKFEFYCDKPHHQKIMLDVLQLECYKQLIQFCENITLYNISQGDFEPHFDETNEFISKIMVYSSDKVIQQCKDQNEVLLAKKRLRIYKDNYDQLHQKVNIRIGELLFLKLYADNCKIKQNEIQISQELPEQLFSSNPEKSIIYTIFLTNNLPYQKGLVLIEQLIKQILPKIKDRNINKLYRKRINLQKLKLLVRLYEFEQAIQLTQIELPNDNQCIFDQNVYQEIMIQQAEICWCQDKYYNFSEYIQLWIQIYRKSRCIDLLLHIMIYLEKGIFLLYYNINIPLVEDIIQCLYKLDQECFFVNYLQFQLFHILNRQYGLVQSGIISQFDADSLKAEQRIIQYLLNNTPQQKQITDNFLNRILFELQCQNLYNQENQGQIITNLEQYLKSIDNETLNFRQFILSKMHYFNKNYEQSKQYMDQCQFMNKHIQNEWKTKISKQLNQIYNFTFSYNDFNWKYFLFPLLFDETNLNAQLSCVLGFKLIMDSASDTEEGQLLYNQLKVYYVKLMLEEYNDPSNTYIHKSFQIKFYILTTLNNSLSDLCQKLIEEIYYIQDNLKIKELHNFEDPSIKIDNQIIDQKTRILNDLIIVQSQLLEESGDPITALKCLDVQYALLLYDKKFEKQVIEVFSKNISHTDPHYASSRCKIAFLKLFLNLFDQATTQLLKVRKNCLDFCAQIAQIIIDTYDIKQPTTANNKIIWDQFIIQTLATYAKPKQLEAFQIYKLIYYQTELKLLEAYILSANYKEATYQYYMLMNHYALLPDPYLKCLFEYQFGIYELNIWEISRAYRFFNRALCNLGDSLGDQHLMKLDELQLEIKEIEAPFNDCFDEPNIQTEILESLNHRFTLKSRCQLGLLYASLFDKSEQYKMFPKIMLTLEVIRKTMGRQSILYTDGLLIYCEYLLQYLEEDKFQDLKVCFKNQYFQSRKQQDYFKPGIYVNIGIAESFNYVFSSMEEIEARFTNQLVNFWIEDLLLQICKFYEQYFKQVHVNNHLSIVNCYILLNRIYFIQGRIYHSQSFLDKAQQSLEQLIPSLEHPLGVILFERKALISINMIKLIEDNIKIILECSQSSLFNQFSKKERVLIVKGILLNDEQLSKYFDDFKLSGFEYYLFQKLELYLNKPKSDLKKIRKRPVLEVTDIVQAKEDAKELARQERNSLINEVETITFYRKAYRICRQIFKNQNILYTRIQDKFIELSRKEQREMRGQ